LLSCYFTAQIDNLGITPVRILINEMGGWPVIDGDFDDAEVVFEELLATFRSKFGTYGIISSYVGADDKNSTANIIHVSTILLCCKDLDFDRLVFPNSFMNVSYYYLCNF